MLARGALELRADRLENELLYRHALESSHRLELRGLILGHADDDILARAERIGALPAYTRSAAAGRDAPFPCRSLDLHGSLLAEGQTVQRIELGDCLWVERLELAHGETVRRRTLDRYALAHHYVRDSEVLAPADRVARLIDIAVARIGRRAIDDHEGLECRVDQLGLPYPLIDDAQGPHVEPGRLHRDDHSTRCAQCTLDLTAVTSSDIDHDVTITTSHVVHHAHEPGAEFLHRGDRWHLVFLALLRPVARTALPVGVEDEHVASGSSAHAGEVGSEGGLAGASLLSEHGNDHSISLSCYLDA